MRARRRTVKRSVAILLFIGCLFPARAWAQPLAPADPVLFVHGLCSSADTWATMTALLAAINPARYGTAVARVNADSVLSPPDTRRMFAIDFQGLTGGFDPYNAAQVPIATKAVELKRVIDEIKRVTGRSRVIVVAHSLGGLVARWYIQHGAGGQAYAGDIAALVTIDTPHLGTSLATFGGAAALDAFVQCVLLPSTNKSELIPGSATLVALNGAPWRPDTPVASIASWQTEVGQAPGDAVVPYPSQSLLSVYPQLANTSVFLVDHPVSLGAAQQILHILVNQLPSTAGLIHTIVGVVDRLATAGTAPGAPQLAVAVDGSGATILQWTAAPSGGAPLAYVLRGVYRTLQGIPTPFEVPVGNATSIAVPAQLAGFFAVHVVAVNAAGESPPSNQVAFSVGVPAS